MEHHSVFAVSRSYLRPAEFHRRIEAHGNALKNKLDWQLGAYAEVSLPLGVTGAIDSTLLDCSDLPNNKCVDPVFQNFGIVGGTNNVSYGEVTNRDYAFYGQGTYAILENLKVTGGIRWTDDVTSARVNRLNDTFLAPNTVTSLCQSTELSLANSCLAYIRTSSTAPTWVVDLEYKPVHDVLAYAKYSRGYREGGINPGAPTDDVLKSEFFTYQPETVDAYELGIKSSFEGAIPGTFNVAGFYNILRNQQITTTFFAPGTEADAILNVGRTRIEGFEAETTLYPFKGLSVSASYTFTGVTNIYPGVASFGSTPNYSLANFNVNWERIAQTRFDAEFFITNAFNAYYYGILSHLVTVGADTATVGEPRMYGVRLRYHL